MNVIRHPNSYGSTYHHMKRTCHILFPNFPLHQSQCIKNCLWLNLRQFSDSNPFLSFIKIRMQYPFDRNIPCLMKYASKWNAAARVTYHQHWARIVYPPSISFYYLDFLPVTVTGWQDFAASLTEKCQSAISIAIYKIHASFKINRPIYILNTLNVCITE